MSGGRPAGRPRIRPLPCGEKLTAGRMPLAAARRAACAQYETLLEFAYDFRTVAKLLEHEERKLMARAPTPIRGECTCR
jgi:hypothetical protein